MMTSIIGFLALFFALVAMTQRSLTKLRWIHLISSILYLYYGILILAYPIILGAILYAVIHIYCLNKTYINTKDKRNENTQQQY